jgi:beta-lactam-binding protein with PASTA domain
VAERYLMQAGLQSGRELQEPNTNTQSGLVITTEPPVGETVAHGSAVVLLVSTGSPACQYGPGPSCDEGNPLARMPDILGQTLEQAKTTLALDGITLGSSILQSSSAPAGTVVCSMPGAGSIFPQVAAVTVGLSSGNAESPPLTLCGTSQAQTSPTQTFTLPTHLYTLPTSPTAPPTSPAAPPTSPDPES